MSTDRFTAAMGYIDDDLISDAVAYMPKKKSPVRWMKWVAVAACFCLVVGLSVPGLFKDPSVGGLESNTTIADAKPEEGISNDALPGGITAEVIEVIKDGQCKVKVIGADEHFSTNDIVTVYFEEIQMNKSDPNAQLDVGSHVVITYEHFNKDNGKFIITVPCIELISKN